MKPSELIDAIAVTAEVMGAELTFEASKAMARELAEQEPEAVLNALRRCQRELTGRLSLAAVLERIDYGHIGADEAWGLMPKSEDETVVWTEQMAEAFGLAGPMLAAGDPIAARMTFRDAYNRLKRDACDRREHARWSVSPGHDPHGRDAPVMQAVKLGRLSEGAARAVLGSLPSERNPKLPSGEAKRLREPWKGEG